MDEPYRLLAIADIQALKARYCHTLDRKDWPAYGAVFVPELVADMREAAPAYDPAALHHGAADYVRGLAALLENVMTRHTAHSPDIELLSEDTARGSWTMEDLLWAGEGSVLPFRWLHGYGRYHETYVKEDGAWRIATIRITRTRIETG